MSRSRHAQDLLRAGQVRQAALICRDILRTAPRDPVALHLLGVAALHLNQPQEAERLIGQALAVRPRFAEALASLGHAQAMLGRTQQALASFDKALAMNPRSADLHDARGAALLDLGRPQDSLASHDKAVALRPEMATAWCNRGNALRAMGDVPRALDSYDQALALDPTLPDAQVNRALTLHAAGRLQDALEAFDQVVAALPGLMQAHNGQGNVLRDLGRSAEALAAFDAAIALAPNHATAHLNRGNALGDLGRLEDALASYTRAVALAPGWAEALYNQGNALRALKRPLAAVGSYQRALAADPEHTEAWNNLGLTLHGLGRLTEALAAYDKALALRPDYHEARWNKALLYLAIGDMRHGFELFDSRWDVPGILPRRLDDRHQVWTGEAPIRGQRILIYPEQGLGDMIQFSRYALLLADRGAHPILEVPDRLARLMRSMPVQVVGSGEDVPEYDCLVPMMSLPLAFGTDETCIPAPIPYLRAEPDLMRLWAERLGERTRPRIGLVWSGNPGNAIDYKRSMALSAMLPLTDYDADFFAVHTERAPGDAALMEGRIQDAAATFENTAALLMHLDLLISVDTSLVHLGGALGMPTWVLLDHDPDWRWFLGRDDSPWYPTIRLFRQTAAGDWDGVIQAVARALRDWGTVRR